MLPGVGRRPNPVHNSSFSRIHLLKESSHRFSFASTMLREHSERNLTILGLIDPYYSFRRLLIENSKSDKDPKEVPMKSGSFQNSGNPPAQPEWLKRLFTLADDCDIDDPLIRVIMDEDLQGLDTPLGLMERYAAQLNETTSHGDIDEKLDKLFLCGRTPEPLEGYYHGITISLKTGSDARQKLSRICSLLESNAIDPLQIIYGRLLSKSSPWAGKNFTKLKFLFF